MIICRCGYRSCRHVARVETLGDAARVVSTHMNAEHGRQLRGDDLADALYRAADPTTTEA